MRHITNRFVFCTAAISTLIGLLLVQSARASIIVVADYHLGESDPGAVAGNIGDSSTIDSAGSNDLTRNGSPTYSNDTGGAFSTLSMSLNGTTDYYSSNTLPTALTNDFGAEIMVKAAATQTSAVVMSGGGNARSWSLWESNGHWNILFEGIGFSTDSSSATAVSVPDESGPARWTQLALVVSGGSYTLYINGVSAVTLTNTQPGTPSPSVFNIGAEDGIAKFDGLVDEARVFTFAPGAFQVSDLTYPEISVPEPATIGLITGVVATAATRRRRQRQSV